VDSKQRDVAEAYMSRVIQRLKAEHFSIEENITYRNQRLNYVAKRTKFEVDKFGFTTTIFQLAKFPSVDSHPLTNFSVKSFKYAGKVSIPWPRGFLYSIVCFPVAIVDDIDTDITEFIRNKEPPKHWAAFEMPVVYSLSSRMLYYCEATPIWGQIYYDQLRQTINSVLAP